MSNGELLLKAILHNPDDDTARLVYADWLQEQGKDERAEFIRVQIELEGIRKQYPDGVPPKSKTAARMRHLLSREDVLTAKAQAKWVSVKLARDSHVKWSRGFITEVRWSYNLLWDKRRLKRLFSNHPIECVHLEHFRPGVWGEEELIFLRDDDDCPEEWCADEHEGDYFFALGDSYYPSLTLPPEMGDLLPGGWIETITDPNPPDLTEAIFYDTEEEANAALLIGVVRYGQWLAGLLDLKEHADKDEPLVRDWQAQHA